jgi:hypothetical protein
VVSFFFLSGVFFVSSIFIYLTLHFRKGARL